jgi:hypothetical protein
MQSPNSSPLMVPHFHHPIASTFDQVICLISFFLWISGCTATLYVALVGLELMISLAQHPECWDYRVLQAACYILKNASLTYLLSDLESVNFE